MRILLLEGDTADRTLVLERLAGESDVRLVADCRDADSACGQVELSRPDVMLVGTETAQFAGLGALLARIHTKRPHLVVMSPSGRYAVEAFSVGAVDYLLSPVDPLRLKDTLNRLRRIMEADQRLERRMDMDTLVNYLREQVAPVQRPPEDDRVPINFGGRYRFVKTRGIRYATADRDCVDIHMLTGEVLHSTNRISELAGKLPRDCFLRIRRSVIVNIAYVREARAYKENYEIIMDDGTLLRPGSTYKVRVRAALVKRSTPPAIQSAPASHLGSLAKA